MKRRLPIFVGVVEALIVLILVYFEPTYAVRGIVHREALFDNRPTSYWRTIVEGDLHLDPMSFYVSPQCEPPTFWQRCTGWVKLSSNTDCSHQLLDNEQAKVVLQELAHDSSPHIAAFARDGLDLDRKLPTVRHLNSNFDGLNSNFDGLPRDSQVYLFWMNQIDVHNMKHRRKIGN
jgi:hypothetical protein